MSGGRNGAIRGGRVAYVVVVPVSAVVTVVVLTGVGATGTTANGSTRAHAAPASVKTIAPHKTAFFIRNLLQ
jgi:hypothetical protein